MAGCDKVSHAASSPRHIATSLTHGGLRQGRGGLRALLPGLGVQPHRSEPVPPPNNMVALSHSNSDDGKLRTYLGRTFSPDRDA